MPAFLILTCDVKIRGMSQSPPDSPVPPTMFTDAALLEQALKPWENVVDQIQALVFWRNPGPMLLLLFAVNLLFFIVYFLQLSLVPTLFLLLALKTAIEIVNLHFGSFLIAALFPPIENRFDGVYVIYPLDEVCRVLVFFTSYGAAAFGKLQPKGPATMTTAASSVGLLVGLLVILYFTGTFWLNFVVVNGLLLLPAVAMHRLVRPTLARFILN